MATLSDRSFPREWGKVASGGLVAASFIPDRGKPETKILGDWKALLPPLARSVRDIDPVT